MAYIRGRGPSVDHSTAGGAILREIAVASGSRNARVAAEVLAYCILGHHAGLPDRSNDSTSCLNHRLDQFDNRLDAAWKDEVALSLDGVAAELAALMGPETPGFDLSVATRMVFSCLVDADFLDTEEYYAAREGWTTDREWPKLQEGLPELLGRLETCLAGLGTEGGLNATRREILAHVRSGAALQPGLFSLTVPTGGGKTLASLAFALDHAAAHGRRRIIYAIPFTSIIDQTARIFRGVLGEDKVLEHHSAIDVETDASIKDADSQRTGRDKTRLAMENWAAPVVVTTNVQLFESLFAARPSRARKLQNIAGSVIVLDEAQTLLKALLQPCLRMLDCLARHWGCTVVFCTATQPAVEEALRGAPALSPVRELAPRPRALADELRRAQLVDGGEMDNDALVAALRGVEQGFVIVNSRAHALDLFEAAKRADLGGLVHLTTRQTAAHRRAILDEVRCRLDPKVREPCRLIATSLILTGAAFPRTLLAAALMRARADQSVNAFRAAMMRAVLVRNLKEEVPVALDEDNPNVAYQLGRLFAVMEGAQYAALRRVNAPIGDRYYAAASSTPARVFATLLRALRFILPTFASESPVPAPPAVD